MGELTIAELRDMNPAERAAHAAAQEERWVLGAWDSDPTAAITLEALKSTLAQWLSQNAVLHATERLVASMRLQRSTTTTTVEGKTGLVKRHTFRLMPNTPPGGDPS